MHLSPGKMNVIVLLFLFLRARSLKAASVDSLAVLASNNERLTVSNLENDDFPSSDEEEGPYDTVILWGVKPVRRVRFDLPDEVPIVTAPKASPTSVAQIFDEWDDFKCDLEWIKSGLISTFERGEMIPNRIIKKVITGFNTFLLKFLLLFRLLKTLHFGFQWITQFIKFPCLRMGKLLLSATFTVNSRAPYRFLNNLDIPARI